LGLTNVDIRGENRVAGLAAVCGDNTIENCYVTGNITGEDYGGSLYQIGGLVAYGGWYGPTTISDCHNDASVTVTSNHKYAGALLGRMINNSTVIRCYNTGDVSGGNNGIGGFIGYNVSCSISESYSTGNISGSGNNYGGFVGINSSSSTIKNCYSLGNVTRNSGSNSVYGGFCGDNGNLVENCLEFKICEKPCEHFLEFKVCVVVVLFVSFCLLIIKLFLYRNFTLENRPVRLLIK